MKRRDFVKGVAGGAGALAVFNLAGLSPAEEPAAENPAPTHKDPKMYTLTKLPYAFNALEPYIDARTVEIHHTKHQQTYVNNLNKALKDHPQLQGLPVTELIADLSRVPEAIRTVVRNNGGGVANHELYFATLRPGKADNPPVGKLAAAIDAAFGDFAAFQKQLAATAVSQFGSGWAWLSLGQDGKLQIEKTPGHDTPVMSSRKPVLVIDVWEHAYYLKHQWRRADSVADWWHLVDWDRAEQNFTG